MAVLTIGALPAARTTAPKTLGVRRRPSSTAPSAARTSDAIRIATTPRVVSSNTGLPGAMVVPAPVPARTLPKRKRIEPPAPPALNRHRAPGVAPSSGTASTDGADYEYYSPSPPPPAPAPSGGGGGALEPVIDLDEAPPADGIPKWAAVGAIAACAVLGLMLLHRQGIV